MLGVIYLLLSKVCLIFIIFTANRYLNRYKISKLSLLLGLLLVDALIYYFLLGRHSLAIYMYIVHLGSALFLFNLFKNYNLIGVTGSIGSGKTSVIRKVKEQYKEVSIIDCDKITHKMFEKSEKFTKRVKNLFAGKDVLNQQGKLDRKKISRIIFDQQFKSLKRKYLFIVYTQMTWIIFKKIVRAFAIKKRVLAILDAPVLFETKFLTFICFPIITVFVDDEKQLFQRVLERSIAEFIKQGNQLTVENQKEIEHDIDNKLKHQMPVSAKIALSDVSVANNGTIQDAYQNFIVEMLKY